ncbi:pentapeptide repeat-containing protein [Micromonospora sp. ATCC 39149]|uniref:Pentapeptide repeat-containing protein n=1 Tax=Micromonospora carbonacea TaxID=47853 RepID=A0A7D6CGB7_9ACTN|nr:pentapeptide repeat-containing protein [Micromonospora sp. ATCC 39149]QLK00818.1 pentapeptide repeat-containing protein [Micromonospora carbonacea]
MVVDAPGVEECRAAGRQVLAAVGAQREAALRRLAQLGVAHPALRQDVADAVCAYLRTPIAGDGPAGDRPDGPEAGSDADARREAVRVLAGLLRSDAGPGATAVDVDLAGATLVDADLGGCELAEARFADTRFLGTTSFAGARFAGDAIFARALFHGEARFDDARFAADAVFGRARFRGPVSFAGAVFGGMAWFGRGEEEIWEDDPAWDTIEEIRPAAWDEPNEDDPGWPVAVLVGDYQEWTEGGDGARFVGPVSFRRARFDGPAWFYKARFGADAAFGGARFGGPVHLDQPTVDLADARWAGSADDEPVCWPLGWTPGPAPDGANGPAGPEGPSGAEGLAAALAAPEGLAAPDGAAVLVPDDSVAPYTRQLADPDPDVRRAGLRVLGELGDARPELRQRVVDAVCGYLRAPLPFHVTGELTAAQAIEVELRDSAQRLLAARLRPTAGIPDRPDGSTSGPAHWAGMNLLLCGATLVDLDLSGCAVDYADFTAAQFHGVTRFDDATFKGAAFRLGGPEGRATFHGDVTFAGARLDRFRAPAEVLGAVAFHATHDLPTPTPTPVLRDLAVPAPASRR